jgi:uncharacterized membrane protein
MQTGDFTDLLGWTLIIIGSVIIISGIASILMRWNLEPTGQRTESRGIILLGPIPIVWGYGKKIWIIAAVIAAAIFLIAILWRP